MNKYLSSGRTEEEICKGCTLYPTKTEATPTQLAAHLATALELSELQRSGASFTYPDGLTALEWSCLSGLTRGRDRAERLKNDRDRIEAKKKARQQKKNNG